MPACPVVFVPGLGWTSARLHRPGGTVDAALAEVSGGEAATLGGGGRMVVIAEPAGVAAVIERVRHGSAG